MIYERIEQLIGNTPIIKLDHLDKTSADVFVKLEFFNPGGSIKDRIAKKMIESAEENGQLIPGSTIVEPTSGNTGIGAAMVGASKGYKVVICMPETMSIERRKLMKAYGAELVLTDGKKGMRGAIEEAERLVQERGYFMLRQFENENNYKAHEETTSLELLRDFPEGFDAFVAGVGTGGTITGVGHVVKKKFPNTLFVAVEPVDSPVLSGGGPGPHPIQGIGAGFIPKILDRSIIDEIMPVSGDKAFEGTRKMAKEYGLLVGISSGAAIYAALEIAKRLGKGRSVVVIAPDNGERYLSTSLYDLGE